MLWEYVMQNKDKVLICSMYVTVSKVLFTYVCLYGDVLAINICVCSM